MTTPSGGTGASVNLATLWIPVMPETSMVGPKAREAGETARRSFDEGFGSSGGGSVFEKMAQGLSSKISDEVSAGLRNGLANMELPGGAERVVERLSMGFEGVKAHTERAEAALKSYEQAHERLTAAIERESVAQARLDDLHAKGAQGGQLAAGLASVEAAHRRVTQASEADAEAHAKYTKIVDSGSNSLATFAMSTGVVSGAISAAITLGAEFMSKTVEAAVEGFHKIIETGEEVVREVIEIGERFEDMHRQIELSSVASGSALEELKVHADALVGSLDTSTDKLGADIATLATRLHMEAGPELDALTKNVEELRSRFGALDTLRLAGAFVQFGVSGEEANESLASLVHTSREFGVNLNGLVNDLATAGPALSELGLNVDQSGHLLGELTAQGMNAAGAVNALTRAEKGAADQHKDLKTFVQDELSLIEQYAAANNKAGAEAEALAAFGTKNWLQAEHAAKSYLAVVKAGPDAYRGNQAELDRLYKSTQNLEERWTSFRNALTVAFAPAASVGLEKISEAVSKLGEWVRGHEDEVVGFAQRLAEGAIYALPAIQTFAAQTIESVKPIAEIFQWVSKETIEAIGGMLNVAGNLAKLPIFKNVFGDWSKELEEASVAVSKAGKAIGDFNVDGALDHLHQAVQNFRPDIQGWTKDLDENTDALKKQLDALNDTKSGLNEDGSPQVWSIAPPPSSFTPPPLPGGGSGSGGGGGADRDGEPDEESPGGAGESGGGAGEPDDAGGATPVQPRSWHMTPPPNGGVGGPQHVQQAGWHPRVEQVDSGRQITESGGGAPHNPGDRGGGGGHHSGGGVGSHHAPQREGSTPAQDRAHRRRVEDLNDKISDDTDNIADLTQQRADAYGKLQHDKAIRETLVEGSLAWQQANKDVIADNKEYSRVTKELTRTIRSRTRGEEDLNAENQKHVEQQQSKHGGRDSDSSPAHDFGSQFLGGIADDLGLGGLFGKSPLEWGLPKLAENIIKTFTSGDSSSDDDNGSGGSGSGSGGGLPSWIASLFGDHGAKTVPDAPHAGSGAAPGPTTAAVTPGPSTPAAPHLPGGAPTAPGPATAQHPAPPAGVPGDAVVPGAPTPTPVPTPRVALPPGMHSSGFDSGGGAATPGGISQGGWHPPYSGATTGGGGAQTAGYTSAAAPRVAQLASYTGGGKTGNAAKIYNGVISAGYSPRTATAAVAAANYESGLDPTIQEKGGSDHWGMFQEQGNYAGAHGSADDQVKWFVDQLNRVGGPSVVDQDPTNVIADKVEVGGYSGSKYDLGAAAQLVSGAGVDSAAASSGAPPTAPYAAANFPAAAGFPAGALPAGMPALDNPASVASRVPNAPNVEAGIRAMGGLPTLYDTSGKNAYQVPAWAQQLAGKFGLTASTYASGGSLHQMGYAFDFNGSQQNMDAFADYVQNNLSPQTLQLIHASGNRRWGIASGKDVSASGYYAGDYGGHFDHVHWGTDVPPIMADQPAGVDDTIVGANSSKFRTAGAVQGGPTMPDFANIPDMNPRGVPHYAGPTLPGPPPNVSNGEHVATTPQSNMQQSSVSNAASGAMGVLGSLFGNPDFNPRTWEGVLHQPERDHAQHSGGATTMQTSYDHSITINNPTVANPDALAQRMTEAQLSRFYSAAGGLPMSGIGSP